MAILLLCALVEFFDILSLRESTSYNQIHNLCDRRPSLFDGIIERVSNSWHVDVLGVSAEISLCYLCESKELTIIPMRFTLLWESHFTLEQGL